jgi:phosphatidate cytidylyltransferase
MLKARILTALVLIPAVIGTLFYSGPPGIALLLGLVMTVSAWEWGGLAGLSTVGRAAYAIALLAFGTAAIATMFVEPSSFPLTSALVAGALFWAFALYAMVASSGMAHRFLYRTLPGKLIAGFMVLGLAWLSAVALHDLDPRRPWLLLFAFLLVWTADTFAYFAGHKFGRHKLAPAVSPGKTIEGVIGGLLGVLVLAVIAGISVWQWRGDQWLVWLVLAVVTALASVVGDLVESQYKRIAGVKDSGTILPGHGGVLDRIDALTAALPVFALGWVLLLKRA